MFVKDSTLVWQWQFEVFFSYLHHYFETSLFVYVFVNKIVKIIYLFAVYGYETCAPAWEVVLSVVPVVLVAYTCCLFKCGTPLNLN